jgi:hypothetical protein
MVDNEPELDNRFAIEEFRAAWPLPIHYVHKLRTAFPSRNGVPDKERILQRIKN